MALAQMKKAQTPKEIVIEWIDHILDRKKWTGTDLARHSDIAPSTILRLLNNPKHRFVPTVSTLQKIAVGSGYPIPKKVMEALGAEGEARADAPTEIEPDNIRRVNVRTARQATVELRHVSPPQLEGDETAFAFHMPDSSLGAWVKTGQLMYATKQRDPVPGDLVVITDKNEKTRVRLLLDITENGLKLSKSIPEKEDEAMPFDDIKDIAIVAMTCRI
jgi:transcriptional regulator with XRE-family HTH domain